MTSAVWVINNESYFMFCTKLLQFLKIGEFIQNKPIILQRAVQSETILKVQKK